MKNENEAAAAKQLLRKQMRMRLSALFEGTGNIAAEYACRASLYVQSSPLYKNANTILLFLSYGHEIDTGSLVCAAFSDGKRVALPRVVPGTTDMDFFVLSPNKSVIEQVTTGAYGISEPLVSLPVLDTATISDRTLIVVPGLAFSVSGGRLGKGKGFYDRYIRRVLSSPTGVHPVLAGFCFSLQIVDSVPVEICDIPLTHLVCERGLTVCRPSSGSTIHC